MEFPLVETIWAMVLFVATYFTILAFSFVLELIDKFFGK